MTWRERIQAARERGRFGCEECLVGELKDLGASQFAIRLALYRNDFDAMERCLDAIEDRALQLKRERGS